MSGGLVQQAYQVFKTTKRLLRECLPVVSGEVEDSGKCLPIVSGEVEDSKKCFAQVLIWVGRVGLLPARSCELIDHQGSHPILQRICIPYQTDIYSSMIQGCNLQRICSCLRH